MQDDAAFRILFGNKRLFLGLLQGFSGVAEFKHVDLKALTRIQARHVSERLHQRGSDALWKISTTDGRSTVLYVMVDYQYWQDVRITSRGQECQAITKNALAKKLDGGPGAAEQMLSLFPSTGGYRSNAPFIVTAVRGAPRAERRYGLPECGVPIGDTGGRELVIL